MAAAPVFVAGSANNAVVAATTTAAVVVTKPAGVVDGNYLIAYAYGANGGYTSFTPPAGWTLVGTNQTGATSVGGGAWFWKVAASEGTSYTFTENLASATGYPAVAITAWSSVAGVDVGPAFTALATNTTAPVAPAITAVADHTVLLCGYGAFVGPATFTAPTGMTTRASTFNSGNMSNCVASLNLAATGTTGTKTATWGSASSGLWTSIALAGSAVTATPRRRIGKRTF